MNEFKSWNRFFSEFLCKVFGILKRKKIPRSFLMWKMPEYSLAPFMKILWLRKYAGGLSMKFRRFYQFHERGYVSTCYLPSWHIARVGGGAPPPNLKIFWGCH
jgi:hypothetical protein